MDYTLETFLGRGGCSEVWLARHKESGQPVAIKIFTGGSLPPDSALRAFKVEMTALRGMKHPGIVSVLDVRHDPEERPMIVMEYVSGRTLLQIIRSRIRHSLSFWMDIMIQAADALEYARRRGVIHCDVKPSNIIVTDNGRVKILDFGISRILNVSGMEDRTPLMRDTGNVVQGSFSCMAPEVAAGRIPDHVADIYSLGATLYHCLSGRPLHEEPGREQCGSNARCAEAPALSDLDPDIPEDISTGVGLMTASDPNERIQDYNDLLQYLKDWKLLCLSREHAGQSSSGSPISPRISHDGLKGRDPAPKSSFHFPYIFFAFFLTALMGISAALCSRRQEEGRSNTLQGAVDVIAKAGKSTSGIVEKLGNSPSAVTRERMATIREALETYRGKHQSNPETLRDLVQNEVLQIRDLVDGWGQPMQWHRESDEIRSAGPDSILETEDDLMEKPAP
ncbi:MAG TPA: serine/threonine-protein kinase [Candidatus Sumerlaeota bacterium]|nr:serine/threonine-protein kinase [Candidatus Sumerlaeota bacterium]